MTPLITLTDIREFKGITLNVNEAKNLTPHILEAQDFELRDFLGESFFLAILEDFEASPSLATYSDLFNGLIYTYQGKKYQHQGIKAILAYHAYARYKSQGGAVDTAFGTVQKNNPYSDHVSTKQIMLLTQQARSGATAHEQRVKKYLDRFSSDYPLWECGGGSTFKAGFRIRKIG